MKNWNPHNIKDSLNGETLGYVNDFTNFKLSLYKNLLKRFESIESTTSIIIQGPLNQRSINTIPEYLKYGEVIVSCWDNDNLSLLDKHKQNIKIVVNDYRYIMHKAIKTNQRNPIILQNYTTYNALKQAEGYSVIKTRSDESYPVLDPLLNMLKKNRDSKEWHKIVTSNIYFRYDNQFKFHPSDHLIAGPKTRMQQIFKESYLRCAKGRIKGLCPEQLIGHSTISTYFDPILKCHEKPDPNRSKQQMKKHFDIIRIRNLPRCTWTSSYRKYDALRGEEDWCHHINDI